MSRKIRATGAPSRLPPEHLINGDSRADEERLIGGETGLAAVMARARMVSRSSAPVLLFGETGTGKEIIARAIHEHSTFRNGPFRRVNCGAIAPELIDSELFGHEQGAFTGAVMRRKGWFEQADGGTLFLDEVGELALAAQVRLLRVVQDGEVIRVGGERPIHVRVRIVAATHRDLPAMVETQTFREDLYYRLSVFPIVIPPLRDRPSDIRAFAEYFAERAANRFGLRPVPVSDDDVRVLAQYRWPGNVREMAAVMDRAVLIGQGRALNVAAALGQGTLAANPIPAPVSESIQSTSIEPLDVVIRRHIEAALGETHGRVEGPHGAARLLRINPHTLRARMRKLEIDWRRFRNAWTDSTSGTSSERQARS
jgi:transcriptional regulator with GAF, ATPase, and Fis domain